MPTSRASASGSIALGFAMQEVVNLRRHREMPEGLREVRWSVLRPQPGVMPEGRVQFAYCHTPELTWPEPPTPLINGADGLTDILLCVTDRRAVAERFGRFAGRDPIDDGRFTVVPLDRGRLVFADPEIAIRNSEFHIAECSVHGGAGAALQRSRTAAKRARHARISGRWSITVPSFAWLPAMR